MIDFDKPVQTGHTPPRIGQVMGLDYKGRHRVLIKNEHGYDGTVYLYRDDGSLRCDGAASLWDLVNVGEPRSQQIDLEEAIADRAAA